MRVKKFEAKNMKDALQMVKNELGPDAVILSARDNRKSFGLAGEASVEITAAVSESTLHKKKFVESRMTTADRQRFQSADARTQRQIITQMVEGRTQVDASGRAVTTAETRNTPRPITTTSYIDIPDEEAAPNPRRSAAFERAAGRNVRELLADFDQDFQQTTAGRASAAPARPATYNRGAAQPVAPSSRAAAAPTATAQTGGVSETALNRIRSAAREAWQAGMSTADAVKAVATQSTRPSAPAQNEAPQANPANDAEVASLKSEIDRLQKMLEGFNKMPQNFVGMHPGADYGVPYDLSFMYQKLSEAGISTDHVVELLAKAAKEIDPVQAKKRPIVDAWVARQILDQVQVVSHPWQGRIQCFVGGAGSGKTATLVKAASHLVVKEKKKIAILTTDTFKVGAVDQLKIYCQILNVPFAVIRNRKDWEWVLGQLKHVDNILVDFPGFQLRDLDEIQTLKSLLPPAEAAAVCHLCVSATAKDGDAYEIAKRYKVAEYGDLIFTNLDQSVQHGIIYNVQKKTGKPLHSFGIGNRIPEDFEAASKERVLDLIFKLTKLRRDTK